MQENRGIKQDMSETKPEYDLESIELKKLKNKYVPYIKNKMRNGELNIEEEIEILKNDKSLSEKNKGELINYVNNNVKPFAEINSLVISEGLQLLQEKQIQFSQIIQQQNQQLMNFGTEILKWENEARQLKIELQRKEKQCQYLSTMKRLKMQYIMRIDLYLIKSL